MHAYCLTVQCAVAMEDARADPLAASALLMLLVGVAAAVRCTHRRAPAIGIVAVALVLWMCSHGRLNDWRFTRFPPEEAEHVVASLKRLPPAEDDCIARELTCQHEHALMVIDVGRGIVLEDMCFAEDGLPVSQDFAPEELSRERVESCREPTLHEQAGNLHTVAASCRLLGTSVLTPCSDVALRWQPSAGTRFCASALPRAALGDDASEWGAAVGGATWGAAAARNGNHSGEPLMAAARVRRVPVLHAIFQEARIHPENLGHFYRDMSFLASLLLESHSRGLTVCADPLPASKLSEWQRSVQDILFRPGLVDATDWRSLARHASTVRPGATHAATAGAAPADAAHNEHREQEHRGQTIYCGQRVQRVNQGGISSASSGEFLASAVRASCGVPARPHAKATRTLLLSLRSGERATANPEDALAWLQPHARGLGLRARAVYFGRLSFCEQVREAASAAVLIGAHGADLANAFFMHADGMLLEGYPVVPGHAHSLFYPSDGRSDWDGDLPVYGQQFAMLGRRYAAVSIFDVVEKPRCLSMWAWMYANCSSRVDQLRLDAALAIVRALWSGRGIGINRTTPWMAPRRSHDSLHAHLLSLAANHDAVHGAAAAPLRSGQHR